MTSILNGKNYSPIITKLRQFQIKCFNSSGLKKTYKHLDIICGKSRTSRLQYELCRQCSLSTSTGTGNFKLLQCLNVLPVVGFDSKSFISVYHRYYQYSSYYGETKRFLISLILCLTTCITFFYKEKQQVHCKEDVTQNCAYCEETKSMPQSSMLSFEQAISSSKTIIENYLKETGSPGLSISVSINNTNAWTKGFGEQDIENHIKMHEDSVIRIASISKPLTMTAVALLVENGKLDLDVPIQKYVPKFPKKYIDGQEMIITTRHLVSHLSGIRHYSFVRKQNSVKDDVDHETTNIKQESKVQTQRTSEEILVEKREKLRSILSEKVLDEAKKMQCLDDEFKLEEYYIKEYFDSVDESLRLFQDDDLLQKPGESFLYSTHAWTLVSAVIEGASGKKFKKLMTELFTQMDMKNTYFETNDDLIYNRAKHYIRNKSSLLRNAPYVDNSYKWAGGGFISTAQDLVKFGNVMLNCFTDKESSLLKPETVEEMWQPVEAAKCGTKHYGMGWFVGALQEAAVPSSKQEDWCVFHTGGAVGASSVLIVLPRGIVVAIIVNQGQVPIYALGSKIAAIFNKCDIILN